MSQLHASSPRPRVLPPLHSPSQSPTTASKKLITLLQQNDIDKDGCLDATDLRRLAQFLQLDNPSTQFIVSFAIDGPIAISKLSEDSNFIEQLPNINSTTINSPPSPRRVLKPIGSLAPKEHINPGILITVITRGPLHPDEISQSHVLSSRRTSLSSRRNSQSIMPYTESRRTSRTDLAAEMPQQNQQRRASRSDQPTPRSTPTPTQVTNSHQDQPALAPHTTEVSSRRTSRCDPPPQVPLNTDSSPSNRRQSAVLTDTPPPQPPLERPFPKPLDPSIIKSEANHEETSNDSEVPHSRSRISSYVLQEDIDRATRGPHNPCWKNPEAVLKGTIPVPLYVVNTNEENKKLTTIRLSSHFSNSHYTEQLKVCTDYVAPTMTEPAKFTTIVYDEFQKIEYLRIRMEGGSNVVTVHPGGPGVETESIIATIKKLRLTSQARVFEGMATFDWKNESTNPILLTISKDIDDSLDILRGKTKKVVGVCSHRAMSYTLENTEKLEMEARIWLGGLLGSIWLLVEDSSQMGIMCET